MTFAATYDATLSRVLLALTSAAVGSATALFDRTIDGVTWTTVRGGSSVEVAGSAADANDYEFPAGVPVTYRVRKFTTAGLSVGAPETATITQALDEVWLKVIARPYLNRPVTVTEVGEVTRPARSGSFAVVGRSFPIGVSDVRASRRFTLRVMTDTASQAKDFDLILASGEPVFLHVPPAFPVPSLYATIGDTTQTEPARGDPTREFDLPLVEEAAPGPDVVGALGTWQTVISTYATWADVLVAKATWADLLQLVGDPSEVLVP